jgi:hypothetical protein
MRQPISIAAFLVLSAIAGAGSNAAITSKVAGGGCCSDPVPNLTHVPNGSYVGLYLAGTDGGVTQTEIRANVSIAMNGAVGFGAGRSISACDHGVSCLAMSYFDFFRPATDPVHGLQFADVMISDPSFPMESSPHPWFFHFGSPPPLVSNRTMPTPNTYNTNLCCVNTSEFWRTCITGTVDSGNIKNDICNGLSPVPGPTSSTGDMGGGQSYDWGDIVFSDNSAVDLGYITGGAPGTTVTQEIPDDTTLLRDLHLWMSATMKHVVSASPYPVYVNGTSRGINNQENAGLGSCEFIPSANCQTLVELPNVAYGGFEFYGQSLDSTGLKFNGSFFPFSVNSATDVIGAGASISELEEYENATFTSHQQLGTSANSMLAYYAAYLLTYNPLKPTDEISWLDVEHHENNQTSAHLSSWPVQTLVPYGAIAIPISNYEQPGLIGLAGCTASNTDSGGIIPYLIPSSCGHSTIGGKNVGVYANASSACSVAGTAIGPCAWFLNITNSDYTIQCSEIMALGSALSLSWGLSTFAHWVGIGQIPNFTSVTGTASGVLGDVIPAAQGGGGGSMTTNDTSHATFTCGSSSVGVMAADSGAIIVP